MTRSRTDSIDRDGLALLLTFVQDGVVSRRQLVELGVRDHDLQRMLRHKDLVRVPDHRAVFVDHTGRLTWEQRAWAAVHAHWPAALARESALPHPDPSGPIHVAIHADRKVRPVPRVVAHRTPDLVDRVDAHRSPPRIRIEHAAIDVAAAGRADVARVFRMLTDVCHTRETDPARIAAFLATRRVPGQRLIADLLDDLATGACSVLERGYLHLVERRHGLPRAMRQDPARAGGRPIARDVRYDGLGLVVELDGRAFHDSARARDRDALRDLDARATEDLVTVRLTYGLVFDQPCLTARRIAALLQRGGWTGNLSACPDCSGRTPPNGSVRSPGGRTDPVEPRWLAEPRTG